MRPARLRHMEESIAHLGLLDDEAITLDTAALEIAALDHPGVTFDSYAALLTEITERIAARGGDARGAADQAEVLADVFAGEFGFTGDRASYDDPDNADLMRVIERRRGLPVSLAILYVAAARRMSWQADVLNTPGHVLIRIASPTQPVLLDPFDDGAVVDAARLSSLLARVIGRGVAPSAEHVAPMSNRGALVRLLLNQATRAEAGGDAARALTVFRRMTLVAPSHSHGWWERARLELNGGDPAAARASLSAMLEVTRDPGLRAHIFAALDSTAGSGS